MLRCVLLDDELLALQYLKLLCEQIEGVEVVKVFNNSEKFISEKDTLDFDVCISDIEMPVINGLQIANLLSDKYLIFTTAYRDFAVESYDLGVIDYITKPVQKNRLEKALQKVEKLTKVQKTTSDYITVISEKGRSVINVKDIFYVTVSEIDSRDKMVHFIDETQLTLKNISFEKLLELLPPKQFCRISKRELIAMSCVNYYSYDEIFTKVLINGKPKTFTIGNNYKNNFLSMF